MSASRPIPPARVPRERAEAVAQADLAALRRRIAALERRPAALEGAVAGSRAGQPWPLGIDALDGALPEGASRRTACTRPRAQARQTPATRATSA
ncbi:MAG: hypothetical protein OXK73_03740 [Rhodospirillaceae bacterium]|nr:hypothetical protein [Rhodospirillaceae bacterium]